MIMQMIKSISEKICSLILSFVDNIINNPITFLFKSTVEKLVSPFVDQAIDFVYAVPEPTFTRKEKKKIQKNLI